MILTELMRIHSTTNKALILYGSGIYCSCGEELDAEKAILEPHQCHSNSRTLVDILNAFCDKLKSKLKLASFPNSPPKNTVLICLNEAEIKSGSGTDFECHECGVKCENFAVLRRHYLAHHEGVWTPPAEFSVVESDYDGRKQSLRGKKVRFHCPIPGCKFHAWNNQCNNFCASFKLLKQHYSKVHASKIFECPRCELKFPSEVSLKRHEEKSCGKKFTCDECGVSYSALESLQTHCRRKGHGNALLKNKGQMRRTGKNFANEFSNSPKLRNIAPKPSHMHLNAALALSELGRINVNTKADIGTQTVDCGKKRSSQTIPTQTPFSSSSSASPARKRTAETQTKRRAKKPKKVIVENDEDLGLCPDILTQDRPLWGVMSTQTSPTYSKFSVSTMTLTPYEDEMDPTAASTSTNASAGDKRKKFAAGGQGQLSTETQTGGDEADVQLWRDDYWNPLSSTTEAETQFDLDDILRSNYTQTGILEQTTSASQTTNICPDDFNL